MCYYLLLVSDDRLINAAVPLSLHKQGAVFNKSRRKRVDFTVAAPQYQKHDSCCPYAQLTTHSSGLVEKAALVFQIENRKSTYDL